MWGALLSMHMVMMPGISTQQVWQIIVLQLASIDLSNNTFTGALPDSWGNLTLVCLCHKMFAIIHVACLIFLLLKSSPSQFFLCLPSPLLVAVTIEGCYTTCISPQFWTWVQYTDIISASTFCGLQSLCAQKGASIQLRCYFSGFYCRCMHWGLQITASPAPYQAHGATSHRQAPHRPHV